MNLKRWEEKEGFKSRFGCRLQMIGGSWSTGGASVFFKYHTSLLFTIKETVRWTASPGDMQGPGWSGWKFQLSHLSETDKRKQPLEIKSFELTEKMRRSQPFILKFTLVLSELQRQNVESDVKEQQKSNGIFRYIN